MVVVVPSRTANTTTDRLVRPPESKRSRRPLVLSVSADEDVE